MGRTKKRYRDWQKEMRKRGQRPPRKSYTWDYMSPGRLVAYADPEPEPQKKGGDSSAHYPTLLEPVQSPARQQV